MSKNKNPQKDIVIVQIKRHNAANDDISIYLKYPTSATVVRFSEIAILEAIVSNGELLLKIIKEHNKRFNQFGYPFETSCTLSKKDILSARKRYLPPKRKDIHGGKTP
jgi:hypothetical protein